MMLSRHPLSRSWTWVFPILLALGFLSAGVLFAGQAKVGVCHHEGNGSYHLIPIADPAYQTHVEHGDAEVGHGVPTHPGKGFDENCNEIPTECPCDIKKVLLITLPEGLTWAACSSLDRGREDKTALYVGPAEPQMSLQMRWHYAPREIRCSVNWWHHSQSVASTAGYEWSNAEALACANDIRLVAEELFHIGEDCDTLPNFLP